MKYEIYIQERKKITEILQKSYRRIRKTPQPLLQNKL